MDPQIRNQKIIMTDAKSNSSDTPLLYVSAPVSQDGEHEWQREECECAGIGARSAGPPCATSDQGVPVPGVHMPGPPLLQRSRQHVCESSVQLSPPATDGLMSGERAQQQLPSWHLSESSPLMVVHQLGTNTPMQQHRYVPAIGSGHPYHHHHIQHQQHVQYTSIPPPPPPPLPRTYQPAPPYPPTHSLLTEQHLHNSNPKQHATQRMKQQTFLKPPTLGGVRANKAQIKVLQHIFLTEKKPTGAMHDAIAERIGMSQGAVRNWFQNQRAKARRMEQECSSSSSSSSSMSSAAERGQARVMRISSLLMLDG
ncbi:hypothetical protein BJ741DRAFT_594439 [Chytriomyces cf. hyalinus JEL632]|nr:hypothetical protein BJ741DRAFT_594439 [Chytriomyces cf. hyalinus JEL632]